MLISALAATALAAPLDAAHFSVGVPLEVDAVGFAVGVRPELLWRPIKPDGALHLRVATGLMVGPELAFVPVSLTVRGRWLTDRDVHPILGFGTELQTFYSTGHPVVARRAWVTELGVDVDVADRW
ncbi:hypothetical protein L6R49_15670, partial [Myxococcota bacterium]|nr:hypothetical protein [Myxococcota bacterium]